MSAPNVATALAALRELPKWGAGIGLHRSPRSCRARPDLPVEVVESVEAAVALAAAVARPEGMTVLVAGGLFLAVEAAQVVRGTDPRALWFY